MQPGYHFVEFKKEDIEQSVPERFEKQAAQNPAKLAIKTRHHQLTYEEFNKFANRVARAIGQSPGDDKAVAILLEHDWSALVSIFGVLKTGRCFVPLDPSLPHARLNYMLDDSEAKIVVTNNQFSSLVQNLLGSSRTFINIDRLDAGLASDNLGNSISPGSMSCILYTSGTTGQPKGVIHTHRNELHNIMHHTHSLCLSADDRLTLLGSYSTGQGMQDLYCALLNGATLYPWSLKSEGLTDLADWLIGERITVYHSAATVFRHLAGNLSAQEEFPDVRIIRLGSEQVSWRDVESYKMHFSRDCIFVNALSSSETKTIRQYVANQKSQIAGRVPVGYPVEDMEVLILDESGTETGPNIVGEIAVRSRYLSPGYWRKPDLTSAAFRIDPSCPDCPIFRTGEWGRMSHDGCLEHLGRKDAQVKIRGFRVETYETELALLQHPAVDQILILCRENVKGDKYLAAYIVVNRSLTPSVSELRDFLKQKIPDYMVPSAFIFLESLPLTPNGKVDRNALPEPSASRPALNVPFVAPQGSIEQALANMWVEILGIDEIGVRDNLFDLGGNSLSAMQIVARVEKTFNTPTPLKWFFQSPTIESLSRNISTTHGPAVNLKVLPSKPAARCNRFPLSFFQERLWFLDQWEPLKAVYNVCQARRLRGRLDPRAVEESLNGVVQRHEILRTTIAASEDPPTQIIAPILRLKLAVIDLRSLPGAERNEQGFRLAYEEARRPFDLAQGPLLRASLVRLAEEEHLFLLTMHQIVCDAWSMQIFLREFWTLYQAFPEKQLSCLAPLSLQYADFTVWQRQWLRREVLEPQLSFWKKHLGSHLSVLNLPPDHPRPALQSFRGARIPLVLPVSLTEALNDLSRQEDVTLFMTLIAAFKTLLYRYTGQEDLAVGFPIANRNWAETAELIGFFVNTLVLRTDLSERPTFKELLIKVRDACLGAYAHQDLPFEKLVEELRPQRDSSRNPLFQAMFAFQNMPLPNFAPPDVTSTPMDVDSGTSKFDLTLSLAKPDKSLTGFFEYSSDLFDPTTIERMMGHFQTILNGIVADRNQRISDLPMLTEGELHQLLVVWNDTRADYQRDFCIHELFEAQAARTPEAIAIEFEGEKLTYRELNIRANQLAHYLFSLGVGPGTLVGICIERSLEMVVGLLGIFKAGAAYVPLDPAYPKERLAFMMRDAQISVLLTQEKFLQITQYSAFSTQRSPVCLDRDRQRIAGESTQNRRSDAKPDNAAYVIYTSGSTGTPKGVIGLHRGAINRFSWMWKNYPFRQGEKSCIKTSLSFIDSVWEVFGPLLQGIPSTIISDHVLKDPQLLVRSLAKNHVTRIVLVPSLLRTILEVCSNLHDHLPELKLWCSSGERLSQEVVEHFRKSLPDYVLLNLYGCSEVSADVSCYDTGNINSGSGISIGRPIANTQIYILDSHLQPVPAGVHGELYIGGDGLAQGYLNRPELTAEKFILSPFGDQPGDRLYRTGDRARYRADGNIEFLGRVDNQVKIRGYRIELGEIETILNEHPAVKESVVVAHERDSLGEKELVGYIVSNQDSVASLSELRGFLQEKLPDYMIPSLLVFLNALPLTPNGKIDRSNLPPPDGSRPTLDQGFVEPRTEIEELVAQVWREVLKLDRIGIYDNFFDLGGHSLLATRVVARLRSNFNIDLPLRKLFELPTVAALAEHADCLRRNQSGVSIPLIVPVPRDGPLPLSFSQRRLWFLHKLNPDFTAYNIPAVFNIKGELDIAALERALNDSIQRHESLRTCISEIDRSPVQQINSSVIFTLPIVDLSHLPKEQAAGEVERLSIDDACRPYDIQNAPLMRAKLLQMGEQEHVLILNFHHIVSDGSSLVIFYQELSALYKASLEEIDVSLPPLQVQYADYAVWQHDWFEGAAWESQLAYWKGQLSDVSPLNLPTDNERPLTQTFRGARLSKTLSMELTEDLKDLSRREGVTRFMILLAAFNLLLSRHTGQEDIVVGSTIAGRNRPELDGVIGFFINALALRTDLSGNPSFIDLLKRVREVCLDAYTHQDLPFEKVVEELNPQRDFSRNPLFQVLFNLADISERVLTLPGCEIVKLSSAAPSAKFDLTVYAPEIDGRVELAIVYDAELFSAARITGLLEQFGYLLSQIVEKPERSIDQYSLVTPSAQAVLPDPTEGLDNSWEGAIHTLFAIQSERVPDRLAVIDADASWTYKELDERSNQLANCLSANGIKPKDVVAIYAHRSGPLVLALLGTLKAGAVFVILDPAYPPARLIDYLKIARPKAWLQMDAAGELPRELANYLNTGDICCRVKLPSHMQDIAVLLRQYPGTETQVVVGANDPAYVAFTSGSTGEPKGVLSRHGPITHFLPWQKEAFDLKETDRFTMLSGLAYSHLHRDVFTALFLGATLFIPDSQTARSPDRLAEWLDRNEITMLHLTPALGELLLTAGDKNLPLVRRIFFGGDVLTRNEAARIRGLALHATVGSFYGATETQRAVGYHEAPADLRTDGCEGNRPIPMGRGIKDVQLLLLNKNRQLAGVGELGEVYVRSPHLADRYIGEDELTRTNFLVNPFTNDPNDRVYKTGEIGRYRPDGNIEWVGRNDRRVNIRGFRVELGEVEAVLMQHPAVREATVMVRALDDPKSENPKSAERLIAYVVVDEEGETLIDLLRSYLSARLPDYMVPAHFVSLDHLPLSPNGKLDYQALPPVGQSVTGQTGSFVAPRNDLEAKLCRIFSQVLGMEKVGTNDNFFRLGGHSLLAAQAAVWVKQVFGVGIDLRMFLVSPTVAALAKQIESLLSARQSLALSAKDEREEFEI